jgi:hypothetical protein
VIQGGHQTCYGTVWIHGPIVIQDSTRLHCSAWVVGYTSTNPADAEIEAVMEV